MNRNGKRLGAGLAGIAVLLLAYWLQTDGDVLHADQPGFAPPADYEHAREVFWRALYADGGHTLYCGVAFTPDDRPAVNIEHVFPMAWVTNSLACGERDHCRVNSAEFNRIEADLHNLFPSLADVNYARGSMRFGEVGGGDEWSDDCDFRIDRRSRTVQPPAAVRGDIARAMFYMQETYGLEIFRAQADILQRWHRQDPVSEEELRRNDAIEALQGTRNPFIDDPDRVARLRR